MLTSSSDSPLQLEVHGHRGCRGLFPENTLPAFLHATALGVDVLEMDVVVSSDGHVVVSHEPWMNPLICLDPLGQRLVAGQEQEHNIYRLPYATIRTYDCGLLQHPAFPEQRSLPAYKPLLSEVVQQVDNFVRSGARPAIRFSIEVKSSAAGDGVWHPEPGLYAQLVIDQLQLSYIVDRTTLLSFDHRVLQQVRRRLPELALCLLVEDNTRLEEHLKILGFVPNVYGPHCGLVTPALMAFARSKGMAVVPWTVNTEAQMQRLLQLNVAGITTDYPDRMLAHLARKLDPC